MAEGSRYRFSSRDSLAARLYYPAGNRLISSYAAYLEHPYRLLAEFDALTGAVDLGNCAARDTGFIFKRKGGV